MPTEFDPLPYSSAPAVELVLGRAKRRTTASPVYTTLATGRAIISNEPIEIAPVPAAAGLIALVVACYIASAAIRRAAGQGLSNPPPDGLEIPFDTFVDPRMNLFAPVGLDEAYLAGAGAIGNGFLWAARHVAIQGILYVTDDDTVSSGNLQRQIWFDTEDVGEPKAVRLCEKAQPFLHNCRLIPVVYRLQSHPNRNEGPWLRRLIVAVDSRRARRHLQNEMPGEVFDASTTGSQEIVLHYNRQPSNLACLGCLYSRDDAEVTHEQAVAAHLGVDAAVVREQRISAHVARLICAKHPQLVPAAIEGLAFDTLYKQLCSSGQLQTISGKQVIAPFAFVSVLAGALLLLDMMHHQQNLAGQSNEWRINPWWPPVPECRRTRPRRAACECCGPSHMRRAIENLWGVNVTQIKA